MLMNIDLNREHIPTPDASKRSGLSKVHIVRLLKSNALEGFQMGRDWFVYTDSLEKYLATPRKPGPKGPIKRGGQKNGQIPSSGSEDDSHK
jgi:hypothetical protein